MGIQRDGKALLPVGLITVPSLWYHVSGDAEVMWQWLGDPFTDGWAEVQRI